MSDGPLNIHPAYVLRVGGRDAVTFDPSLQDDDEMAGHGDGGAGGAPGDV